MSFRTILVVVDADAASDARLDAAIDMARRNEGRVLAVAFAANEAAMLLTGGYADIAFFESERKRVEAVAEAARARAQSRLEAEEVGFETRVVSCVGGDVSRMMAENAAYADLAILPQPADDWPNAERQLAGALFDSPTPALVWPQARAAAPVGRRIMIAWDAGKEVGRAARAAMPLLRAAESTTVVTVERRFGGENYGEDPGADFCAWLARHGVRAELKQLSGSPVAATLLEGAVGCEADLIVMGGYGHSRLREAIFGGVTQDLMEKTGVPLFVTH